MEARLLWLGAFLGGGLLAWVAAGWWVTRGVNEPPYSVVSADADVEVRRYEPTIVASTIVEGDRDEALGEGFRRLAGYIFGGNKSKTSIAMTAPVSARPSERIAMTAPVSAAPTAGGQYRVTFAMPAHYTMETLPEPDDERVALEVEPARRVAVVSFRGWATDAAIASNTNALAAWLDTSDHEASEAPVLAQYDPPFKMPLLRRNEMMLTLR